MALALGGGAARGWSHIGVLRALDDSKIPVEMIAGTSIGALVGGCYLSGHLDELEEFARSLTRRRIVGFLDFSLRGSGLISGIKLAERMESHLKDVRIEDLGRTLVCVATEIRTGHEVWLSHGPIIDAIRASYALPGIFEPVAMHDRLLVDGALVNPVPVSVCRVHEASCVVAINLNSDIFGKAAVVRPKPNPEETVEETGESGAQDQSSIGKWLVGEQGKSMGMTGVMVEAFNIIQDRISRSRLAGDPPDLMFSPRVGHVGLSEFHRADETIDLGYQATMEQIDRIREAAEAGRLAHA
ncbi:MAG: patatin-like phospholipase family protein [Pseudomonadota bacterium]